jgi:hypothetical protein
MFMPILALGITDERHRTTTHNKAKVTTIDSVVQSLPRHALPPSILRNFTSAQGRPPPYPEVMPLSAQVGLAGDGGMTHVQYSTSQADVSSYATMNRCTICRIVTLFGTITMPAKSAESPPRL